MSPQTFSEPDIGKVIIYGKCGAKTWGEWQSLNMGSTLSSCVCEIKSI